MRGDENKKVKNSRDETLSKSIRTTRSQNSTRVSEKKVKTPKATEELDLSELQEKLSTPSKSVLQESTIHLATPQVKSDAGSNMATPAKSDGEGGSFLLSPIPNKSMLTQKTTPNKRLEREMKDQDDPYEDIQDRRDSGRFKPTKKKKNKDEVSPRTLKMIEDKGKKHYDDTKKFYELVDAENLEDCFEII